MVEMKEFTRAVNQRCMQAMAAAGYKEPRAVSMSLKDPMRPSFETLIESQTVPECSGEFLRRFEVSLYFFPADRDRPNSELKLMDDCITKAFCLPLEVCEQELSTDENGIRNEIQAGCLVSALRFESTMDINDISDAPLMQELEISEEDD